MHTHTSLAPKAFAASSFWSLAVCKNRALWCWGWWRPGNEATHTLQTRLHTHCKRGYTPTAHLHHAPDVLVHTEKVSVPASLQFQTPHTSEMCRPPEKWWEEESSCPGQGLGWEVCVARIPRLCLPPVFDHFTKRTCTSWVVPNWGRGRPGNNTRC